VGHPILVLFDNALVGMTHWPEDSAQTISSTAVVGKYTYAGDADFDGQVTGQDYTAIDANLGATGIPLGISWFYGDMDGDGNITGADYTGIDASLGLGIGAPLSATAVPEAGGLGVAGCMGLAWMSAKRRPRKC
jgi:hypothetical protein